MKRKISTILAILATAFCMSACDAVQGALEQVGLGGSAESSSVTEQVNTDASLGNAEEKESSDSSVETPDSSVESSDSSEETPDSSVESSDSSEETPDSSAESSDSSEETPDSSVESSDSSVETPDSSTENSDSSTEEDKDEPNYTYNAFTPTEKKLFETYLGEVLPFVANNEYYVETYESDYGYTWVNFYTFDNTQADFNAYKAQYSGYTFVKSYRDEDNDMWYCYEKGNIYVEIAYYVDYDGSTVIDVYAVNEGQSVGGGEDDDDTSYLYHEFTAQEEALFVQYIGEVIPFLPNDEYYVEGYYDVDDYENGMCYIVCDVTAMGFALYRGMYSSDYDFVEEY